MQKSIFLIIVLFVGAALIINLSLREPVFDSLSEQAEFEIKANAPARAEKTLYKIISQDLLNVDHHYRYISTHFNLPERRKTGRHTYKYRDDQTILRFYDSLSQSAKANIADIGLYGKGLIYANLDKYTAAIFELEKVNNRNLRYLNNSLGSAYQHIGSIDTAEHYFRKEIDNNGNLSSAYFNLSELLFDQGRLGEVKEYLKNIETKKYVPLRIKRSIYFQQIEISRYAMLILNGILYGTGIWSALAALLIMISWMMYLRKVDIFEVEKWRHIIAAVVWGMLFSFLVYPLADFNNLVLGFKLNGGLVNDFLYCVVGIGAIEELVKIAPLIIMIKFTKAVNEPFDYIKYASLSALGFAFVENLGYFGDGRLHIIHGRALTSAVSHMFDSSIIAYGIILNRYKTRNDPYLNFALFFLLASIAHGFYDFWLINKTANAFSVISVVFVLVSISFWNLFKNNALNHSEFYDKTKSIDNDKLRDYLLYSLAGVLLFEYVSVAFKYGPDMGNHALLDSLYSGTYLMVFLSVNLTQFKLIQGKWAPLKSWGTKDDNQIKQ